MSATLARRIGLRIAYYRKLQGYTQQQLAQKTDISFSYLGKIECGALKNCASLPLLMKIASGLDISLMDLLNDKLNDNL
ncbi:helix-turn-helix domain-containing protein [Pectinatus cerevisiiphilus]|uniref:Helix-turn-helix protein n=1 Tax=Pectinatus cerevisiiphilus TaxID=86956 RepID=A0A4R3K3W6_9FIRM|nr:helix-turn-helix transcriptional regulator [Pectinatus cerevisiiphilus]TCS77341.1 helix-turn-helix protein [Pectinatus cerevisiiphilus]